MSKVVEEKMSRLFYDEDFLTALDRYVESRPSSERSSFFNQRNFTLKDTQATYRLINHWSSFGLFEDLRSLPDSGWRRFSIVDLTWLKILSELREFGFSLEKLKVGYQSFMKKSEFLEFGISLCFLRKSVCLIVFSDGHMEMADRRTIAKSECIREFQESYLVISINSCLGSLFPRDFTPDINAFELSEKEENLLVDIRSQEYDEISVHFKNGEINCIDKKTKIINEIGKLSDIFNTVLNGDFLIKKSQGKICFVEKIDKKKV